MRKLLIPAMTILCSLSAFSAESCRPGFSVGSLSELRDNNIDSIVSEVRGGGLFYLLQIEISSEASEGERSANNTINISASAPASDESYKTMEAISQKLRGESVTALCIQNNPESYYHNMVLPKKFNLKQAQLPGSYVIDLVKPFAK